MANYDNLVRQFQNDVTSDAIEASTFTKKDSTTLRYPLNNQDDYGGTVTFRARTPEYDTLGVKAIEFLKPDFFDRDNQRTDAEIEQEILAAKQFEASAKQNVTADARPGVGDSRKCTLYLPGAIQIQDRVTYNNVELGAIGAGVRSGIQSGASAGELISSAFGNIADNFASVIGAIRSGDAFSSQEAQVAALRVLKGSAGVSGAISSATGVALNPNRRSILSGPELRSFSFSFKLIPTSPAEARSIEKIIQFFREEMYPEAIRRSGVSVAFTYPAVFDIIMRYKTANGQYKKVATQLLPSFLQSVDVNYNQSGMSFHSDGKPQEATLTLNFTEERTLNKYDVAVRGY